MQKQLYYRGEKDAKKIRAWQKKLQEVCKRSNAFHLRQAALLVVDMQHYFLDEDSHAFVPSGPAILPNVSRLVQWVRSAGRPVVFTYFAVKEGEEDPIGRWWGRTVFEGTPESGIVRELQPIEGELVLRKSSYSSFHETVLEEFLKSRDTRSLVVTGVLTNLCCETAAREAFSCGFDVFVPPDATAAFNEEMHIASLLNLSCGFAAPLTTDELLHSV